MEYFRMDYSLSIFIPECGITPERLKKVEFLSKMGLFPTINPNDQKYSQLQLPLLYYIMYYFIYNIKTNPENVMNVIMEAQGDIEKKCDTLIDANQEIYLAEQKPEGEEDLPLSVDRSNNANVNSNQNQNVNTNINSTVQSERNTREELAKIEQQQQQQQQPQKELQRKQQEDQPKKKSYEYEDNTRKRRGFSLDDDDEVEENIKEFKPKEIKREETPINNDEQINLDTKLENKMEDNNNSIGEEIVENIEDSFERSNDKKSSSNNQTVSQSQGWDQSVDSHAIENSNYIEPVDKKT